VHSIGAEGCKILIVDNLVPDARPLVDLAASLAPFPKPEGIPYPGLRRYIGERDREAAAYVAFVCRAAAYQAGALQDFEDYGEAQGYIGASTEAFERIFDVEGVFNRCLIYTGAMLHLGQLAGAANFSPDPRQGRLAGNIFIRVDAADLGPYMAV